MLGNVHGANGWGPHRRASSMTEGPDGGWGREGCGRGLKTGPGSSGKYIDPPSRVWSQKKLSLKCWNLPIGYKPSFQGFVSRKNIVLSLY